MGKGKKMLWDIFVLFKLFEPFELFEPENIHLDFQLQTISSDDPALKSSRKPFSSFFSLPAVVSAVGKYTNYHLK